MTLNEAMKITRLKWYEEGDQVCASSIAYGSTEGVPIWRIRKARNYWRFDRSDSELIAGLSRRMLGYYADLDGAKLVCEELDYQFGQQEAGLAE